MYCGAGSMPPTKLMGLGAPISLPELLRSARDAALTEVISERMARAFEH